MTQEPASKNPNTYASDMRCGFLVIVGEPNAGKSTLINALVGDYVTIVSPKVQTTRNRILGIKTTPAYQLILVDTPGIFQPRKMLERFIVKKARQSLDGSDCLLLIADARKGLTPMLSNLIKEIKNKTQGPVFLALNKVDICSKEKLLDLSLKLNGLYPFRHTFMISAHRKEGLAYLEEKVVQELPRQPFLFPPDQLSDASEKFFSAEITRQKLFQNLYQEIPYALTVQTESFQERPNDIVIHQKIYVKTEAQKKIVVGRGGEKIKTVGTQSRQSLSRLFGRPVHLYLLVSVRPLWDEKPDSYANDSFFEKTS